MMTPEATIAPTIISEIVGEVEIPCEYGDQFQCGPAPAGVRLACTDCKDAWLTADSAAECPACGDITAPARHIFWYVAAL